MIVEMGGEPSPFKQWPHNFIHPPSMLDNYEGSLIVYTNMIG